MRLPLATYRLQFTPEFRFVDAREVVSYLRDLGITDLYASPVFHARPGSLHGYDVVDPGRLNPELGTSDEFESVVTAVHRHGMGWIQDIVPNHMAYDGRNRLLMDVLENGRGSPYCDYFDIDWNHPYESIRGRVLAPFLGDFYGTSLEKGEITLRYAENGLTVNYYALTLPLHIESYATVLGNGLGALRRKLGPRHPDLIKYLGVLYVLKNLPPREENAERTDQIAFIKAMLWELYSTNETIREAIDANVSRFNGVRGDPASFNALDQLLGEQLYRLSFWKVAAEELNYRRFFNINELISLRVEEEKVFRQTHALIFKLVGAGRWTGLRVDHIDGLYDPSSYLNKLRQELGDRYLTVEKILDLDETLPAEWPVEGTTGYDFLNYLNGIFCARDNERRMTQIYQRFTGLEASCNDIAIEKKRLIIGKYMAGDVDGLAHLLKRISSRDRHAADVTLYGLRRALVEALTFFPVYRSYVNQEFFSREDRARLEETIRRAKESNPGLMLELNFIQRFLLLDGGEPGDGEKRDWTHFIMRFQQLTGPLMAKGFEDTTLYVYNRLLSLNEVGGNPAKFGISVDEFHRFNVKRIGRWPHSMNATATHDTKRGEDARARLNVLSELPEQWERSVRAWSRLNRAKKTALRGREVPDRNDEYFLYQTLAGTFPVTGDLDDSYRERLKAYVTKAVREAKVHTEWLKPDLAYEEAFTRFIERSLEPVEGNRFLVELATFVQTIAFHGMLNSLSQALVKAAAPGVPDFYQGTELWDLSFVDPDNRRAVDFRRRRELLDAIKHREQADRTEFLQELLRDWPDGRIKLYVIYKALRFRREHGELFSRGAYVPLRALGAAADHVYAFERRYERSCALVAVPRLTTKISDPQNPHGRWGETILPLASEAPEQWLNVFTGNELRADLGGNGKVLPLAEVFRGFPVALLEAVS
ncbi:MAG TPA: malto-oligosyltrehalose synthase [Candidatus Eisenbacteria bacterium]|nr:malto-oligosyltrehalose synthase [Candidatus Eisenbacteria bacterium]